MPSLRWASVSRWSTCSPASDGVVHRAELGPQVVGEQDGGAAGRGSRPPGSRRSAPRCGSTGDPPVARPGRAARRWTPRRRPPGWRGARWRCGARDVVWCSGDAQPPPCARPRPRYRGRGPAHPPARSRVRRLAYGMLPGRRGGPMADIDADPADAPTRSWDRCEPVEARRAWPGARRRPRPRRAQPGPTLRRRGDDVVPGADLARARPARRGRVRASRHRRQAGAAGGERGRPRSGGRAPSHGARRATSWSRSGRADAPVARSRHAPSRRVGRDLGLDRSRTRPAPGAADHVLWIDDAERVGALTTAASCCSTTCCGSSPTCASSTPVCSCRTPPTAMPTDRCITCSDEGRLAEVVAVAARRPRRGAHGRGCRRRSTPPSSGPSTRATSSSSTPARPSRCWRRRAADG